nr:unnamed protein product [Callosobruchus analis]
MIRLMKTMIQITTNRVTHHQVMKITIHQVIGSSRVEAKLVHGPNNSDTSGLIWKKIQKRFPFCQRTIQYKHSIRCYTIKYFQLFFDDSTINIIIQETNRRGREDFDSAPVSTRRKRK